MARKNRTTPDTWRWGIYLVIGVLFMAVVVFFSGWRALRTTEARFCQILDFVKSQSTSFEKYNDTVVAKTLRRAAVSVHQLAQAPALDLSDPQCLNRQAELLWLTGISVLSPDGTLLCESTTNGIGYARFRDQLKNDTVLDVFSYPQKTYLKRVLLEDGSAVDVAAHRAESKEVILLAYRYTPAEFIEGTALSIQSVLDGYSVETSGTLFIVQNNQVIASNRPELIGQDAADSPLVREIRKAGAAKTLTHTHDWNGSGCYFGMYCHGRSFDLYAYTDEKSVFRESFPLILMALAGYILLVMVLWVLRRRSVQEMEQQEDEDVPLDEPNVDRALDALARELRAKPIANVPNSALWDTILANVIELGFTRHQAASALLACNMNSDHAAEVLFQTPDRHTGSLRTLVRTWRLRVNPALLDESNQRQQQQQQQQQSSLGSALQQRFQWQPRLPQQLQNRQRQQQPQQQAPSVELGQQRGRERKIESRLVRLCV